jgi:hypothetical protein
VVAWVDGWMGVKPDLRDCLAQTTKYLSVILLCCKTHKKLFIKLMVMLFRSKMRQINQLCAMSVYGSNKSNI